MKLTRKQFFKTLFSSSLALLVGPAAGCKPNQPSTTDKNPYEYNIDQFKRVDQSLIAYQEKSSINLGDQVPKNIAFTTDDQIIISTERQILRFSKKHTLISSFAIEQPTYGLAAQSKDMIYIAFKDHIAIYNNQGKKINSWPTLGEKAFITGLDVNATHVVIADYGNKQLWLFDHQGSLKKLIAFKTTHHHGGGGFKVPSPYFDVHFDPNGTIWTAHPGMHRIENYSLDGQLISSWGRFGMDLAGFSGCCNPTHFALLPNQQFITVEKGLVRVKVYDRSGKLISVVAPAQSFTEGLTGIDLAVDQQGKIYLVDRLKKQIRIFSLRKK